MEGHLDLTIDFETCSLASDAAVMQAAVVPWDRDAEEDPFGDVPDPLTVHVDLRSCFVEGFDFDASTAKWWASQSQAAKEAVTDGTPVHVADMTDRIVRYLKSLKKTHSLRSLCLWSQGPDVDIAILRSLFRRYGIHMESLVPHTSFRDSRTVILEAVVSLEASRLVSAGLLADPRVVYEAYDPLPEPYSSGTLHDALYDARRSSWYTWQALRRMRGKTKQ